MALLTILAVAAVTLGAVYLLSDEDSLRRRAVRRLVVGGPVLAVVVLLGSVFLVFLVTIYAADVTWQLATGRPGLSVDGHAGRLWDWRDRWTRYTVYGEGPRPSLVP